MLLAVPVAALLFPAAQATPETLESTIRVGLKSTTGTKPIRVVLTSPGDVADIETVRKTVRTEPVTLTFSLQKGKVVCSPLSLSSPSGFRITAKNNALYQIGTRTYRGPLEIAREGSGLQAVVEADLEDYVFGSLLLEGAPSLQPESLKSLAVAVRTFAIRSRGKHNNGLYDVCDTTHCQGFAGIKFAQAEWARAAQMGTSGQILMWEDRPIWAAYSTDCGGATANNEDSSFGETPFPYLRAQSDTDDQLREYCATSSAHRWTKEIPASRLEALFNAKTATRIGRLKEIEVDRADAFGRAVTLRLRGETKLTKRLSTPKKPTRASSTQSGLLTLAATTPPAPAAPPDNEATEPLTRTIRATALRSLLGPNNLKSTFFTVERSGDLFRFHGRGYGHGVGMCMIGANGMAKAGIPYRDILSRYYTGASLVQLYEPLPDDAPRREDE